MATEWARESARGLLVQWQVVHALILRETRTRFGAEQLGYVWALLGPVSTIGTFAGAALIVGRVPPLGDDSLAFFATGFVPFMFFRSVASRGEAAIAGNRSLLFYPQVHPLDLILARTLLEVATLCVVAVVLLGGTCVWHQRLQIDSLVHMLLGIGLASGLGAGLGLILCSANLLSSTFERVSGILLRPLFWVSGIFFTANDLPSVARDVLVYNPVLHCTEWMRHGWYPEYTARYASISYPALWVCGLCFVGLVMERVARSRVGAS